MNAGLKIKQIRKEKGIMQKELANKVGIGINTLLNYEKGYREIPTGTLVKIVEILEIDWSDLFKVHKSDDAVFQIAMQNQEEERKADSEIGMWEDFMEMVEQLNDSNFKMLYEITETILKNQG